MGGEIEITIHDDGRMEVDLRQSGLTTVQKKALREELAATVDGKIEKEKHAPAKVKPKLRIHGG